MQKSRVELIDSALDHWHDALTDDLKEHWTSQLEHLTKSVKPTVDKGIKVFIAGSNLAIKDTVTIKKMMEDAKSRDGIVAEAKKLLRKMQIGDNHYMRFVESMMGDLYNYIATLN